MLMIGWRQTPGIFNSITTHINIYIFYYVIPRTRAGTRDQARPPPVGSAFVSAINTNMKRFNRICAFVRAAIRKPTCIIHKQGYTLRACAGGRPLSTGECVNCNRYCACTHAHALTHSRMQNVCADRPNMTAAMPTKQAGAGSLPVGEQSVNRPTVTRC